MAGFKVITEVWECSGEYSNPIQIRMETTLSFQSDRSLNLRSGAGAYPIGSVGRRAR
jgi:hypothetical protein